MVGKIGLPKTFTFSSAKKTVKSCILYWKRVTKIIFPKRLGALRGSPTKIPTFTISLGTPLNSVLQQSQQFDFEPWFDSGLLLFFLVRVEIFVDFGGAKWRKQTTGQDRTAADRPLVPHFYPVTDTSHNRLTFDHSLSVFGVVSFGWSLLSHPNQIIIILAIMSKHTFSRSDISINKQKASCARSLIINFDDPDFKFAVS